MADHRFTRRLFLQTSVSATLAGLYVLTPGASALAAAVKGIPPTPRRKPRAPRLLVLDPGHGGRDPGAIGRKGTKEKDITLDIALRMAKVLSGKPGLSIKLTRNEDVFLPLEERVEIGRDARADLFLSIHADSAPNKAARGLSVYTLSEEASDAFSKDLAEHENGADLMGGLGLPPMDKEVTAILMDLATRQTRNTAQHARATFVHSLKNKWPLLERPMRAANFVVLRAPDVPSMLVETGFLSNVRDERILRKASQREKIARLMARNIAAILNSSLFG